MNYQLDSPTIILHSKTIPPKAKPMSNSSHLVVVVKNNIRGDQLRINKFV